MSLSPEPGFGPEDSSGNKSCGSKISLRKLPNVEYMRLCGGLW